MKQRSMRLAHHLGQHVEAAAMRHADHDLLHAEIAAALDDLLQRRNQRFAAVQPEALGAGEFEIAEFLETFGLDQVHQDRAPALAGEADFLVRTLYALLDPGLLRTVGDVHELDAERLAIGAFADRHDLAQGRVFEAEHMIEEDLAVVIGLREAVGARIELLAVARRLDTERVELGVEMAAHAVGPNQHQGADRIARRLVDIGRGQLAALGLRLGGDLGADGLFHLRPVAVERRSQPAPRRPRPLVPTPGQPFGVLYRVGRLVLQALEEGLPVGVHRSGILLVAGIEVVDIGGVGALQKRGEGKGGVRVLARHDGVLVIRLARGKRRSANPGATDQRYRGPFTLSRSNVRPEKNQELNYDFNFSTSVLPRRAGDGDTVIPADSIAAVLEPASPLPPEMMAPACPMRRPGGAVTPAMKPTIGFLRPRLASSLMNCAASSSAEPPISPIMTIEVVLGSARNISSMSMNSVPLTGSPPMPTAVVWPRPSWVVWNTAS